MTTFLRLLTDGDKARSLAEATKRVRQNLFEDRSYELDPQEFGAVPAKPFAYWVSKSVRGSFCTLTSYGSRAQVTSGTGTLDDFRFLRCWWEVIQQEDWYPFAKGGAFSQIYYDQHLIVNWTRGGAEMKEWIIYRYQGGHWARNIRSTEYYFRPGLTWPRRTQGGLSLRAMPAGCIFADKGPAAFVSDDDPEELLALLALSNSRAFELLVSLQMAFGSYEVGVIQRTPVPALNPEQRATLASLAHRAWGLKRDLDAVTETSHAFLLPAALLSRAGIINPLLHEAELTRIQAEINEIAFDLYAFSEADRYAAIRQNNSEALKDTEIDEEQDDDINAAVDEGAALLSWAAGVAFGRFDWRFATAERAAPPAPEPFDPLPAKSPGMLPDGAEPFQAQAGILVDDPGNPYDLVRVMERVLERVEMPVPTDLQRWLQRDFFPFHSQRYSKSRRKAPIYWPLSTASGSYTLWLYYPSLSSETLYSAINDFVDPKLTDVARETDQLRVKGGLRSRGDEKRFEQLAAFEAELRDLRDQLQAIAVNYHPSHDDGVQISAAPLWPLFRHKPWQKVLKDTWAKLEKGDYDWSHLAMSYWPDRVHEKCKTDKSLAIAHGLEKLYVELGNKPKKRAERMT